MSQETKRKLTLSQTGFKMLGQVFPYRKVLFYIRRKHLAYLLITIVILVSSVHLWTNQSENQVDWKHSTSQIRNNVNISETHINTDNDQENNGLNNISSMLEKIMTERNFKLNEICHSELSSKYVNYPLNAKEFFINYDYKLIWCNIFKAASTTWIVNFLKMKNVTDFEIRSRKKRVNTITLARSKFYPRPALSVLKDNLANNEYTSFMIVRDPLERLLSTYINKISKYSLRYEGIKCQMIQSFFKWILSKRCNPTFSEFVTWILKSGGRPKDEHLASYVSFCSPCQAQFTFILHFENLKMEHAFLTDKIPKLKNIGIDRQLNNHRRITEDVIKEHVSQLDMNQLLGLANNVYKFDLQMFGYDIEKYKKYVRNSEQDYLLYYLSRI